MINSKHDNPKTENNEKITKYTRLLDYHLASIIQDPNSEIEGEKNDINANTLAEKAAEILSKPNNWALEKDFRRTCLTLEKNSNSLDLSLMEAYQNYRKAYQQCTSLYNIQFENDRVNLHIYNTEASSSNIKILNSPVRLDHGTCIAQLPSSQLFCFGAGYDDIAPIGNTLIIDEYFDVQLLPSGADITSSSCIYFNNSVYCFGGWDWYRLIRLSNKFDLKENRWIKLTPIPEPDALCNCIIFKGNILISGYFYTNLFLYSIDIDSFSTIPHEFNKNQRKILINAENRLYLIELRSIYESDVENEYIWTWIADPMINYDECKCIVHIIKEEYT